MNIAQVRVKRVRPDARALPARATEQSAGLDLCACVATTVELQPGARAAIPTGLAFEFPPGLVGLLCARSGLAARHGLQLANGVGVIDADYRGELSVLLLNAGDEPVTITPNQRIAQLVLLGYVEAQLSWSEALGETERGGGGFGSTG